MANHSLRWSMVKNAIGVPSVVVVDGQKHMEHFNMLMVQNAVKQMLLKHPIIQAFVVIGHKTHGGK